jgi:cell division protein YceG involved in septum cleavage
MPGCSPPTRAGKVSRTGFRQGNTASPSANVGPLLHDLVSGAVATYEVRIVEGTTIMRVVEQLADTPKLVDDLGDVTAETLMAKLQLGNGHAEAASFRTRTVSRKERAFRRTVAGQRAERGARARLA